MIPTVLGQCLTSVLCVLLEPGCLYLLALILLAVYQQGIGGLVVRHLASIEEIRGFESRAGRCPCFFRVGALAGVC